jgi:hypothetical protein
MSLWDSITDAASSAYDGAGSALSSAFNKTQSVTSGLIDSAKQSVSAVGDGLANLAEKGIIATTMDNGKSAMPSPGPDAAPSKKSASPVLTVAVVGAIVGIYLLTRKKG